jgi:ABC-2 type transport system ATP-binding protein
MVDPEILLLDEPTSGLDPVMQERFIEFMKAEKKRGKTILLSSHIFSEVDAVCDRVAIIKEGKIVSTVDTDEIKHNQNKIYFVRFETPAESARFATGCGFETSFPTQDKQCVEVKIKDEQVNQLINSLSKHHVVSFKEEKFTLQKHFMHFYGKGDANE